MENKSNSGIKENSRSLNTPQEVKLPGDSTLQGELKDALQKLKKLKSKSLQNKSNYQNIAKSLNKKRFDKYFYSTINEIKACDSLFDVFKTIGKSKHYKLIENIQFMIHRLGYNYADSFTTRRGTTEHKRIPADRFNAIYNTIYKSKSSLFNQTHMLAEDIDSTGIFFGQTNRLNGFNLITIVSNNSFLSPSEAEIDSINILISLLKRKFETLIRTSTKKDKDKFTKALFENHPNKLKIKTNDSQEFKNFEKLENDNIRKYSNNGIELEISQSELSKSNIYHHERISLLGELLNTLRHELSNPLFGLNLSASTLMLEDLGEEATETTEEILEAAKRCENIIKNFSHLYKEENSVEDFNLFKLIKETIVLTKSETKHINKEINLIDIDESKLLIRSNPTWISQIIFNLLINSAHAFEHEDRNAKIDITISMNDDDVFLKIKDNGCGISQENSEQIFKAFYTTKEKGTGLGLSICKNLAQKLNGDLNYIPTSNGACFELRIKKQNNTTH